MHPAPSTRASVGLALVLLAGCSGGGTADASPEGAVRADSLCPFVEVERERLVLDPGIEAYVEPQAVLIDPAGTFMAGLPSYTYDPATQHTTSRDRILAIHRSAGPGAWTEVANPLADAADPLLFSPVVAVRALALGERRWAVLIGERGDDLGDEAGDEGSVRRLWYAEIGEAGASALEPVPIPDERSLLMLSAPPLASAEGELVWAAIATKGRDDPWSIVVFRRAAERWRVESLPGRGGSDVALAWAERTGWTLGSIEPEPEDAELRNAVILFRRAPQGWRRFRSLGAVEPGVHLVDLYLGYTSGGELVATWQRRAPEGTSILAAMRADLDGEPFVVDASSSQGIPLASADGSMLWASHHESVGDTSQVFRVVRASPRGSEVVGALPHPYTGYFAATLMDDGELRVVGPEYDARKYSPVSLFLRMRPRCRTTPR